MQTITSINTNASVFIFEDNDEVTINSNNIVCPEFIIGYMNSSNAEVHSGVTPPDDWARNKYLLKIVYNADETETLTWSANPDWVEPEEKWKQFREKYNLTETGEPS